MREGYRSCSSVLIFQLIPTLLLLPLATVVPGIACSTLPRELRAPHLNASRLVSFRRATRSCSKPTPPPSSLLSTSSLLYTASSHQAPAPYSSCSRYKSLLLVLDTTSTLILDFTPHPPTVKMSCNQHRYLQPSGQARPSDYHMAAAFLNNSRVAHINDGVYRASKAPSSMDPRTQSHRAQQYTAHQAYPSSSRQAAQVGVAFDDPWSSQRKRKDSELSYSSQGSHSSSSSSINSQYSQYSQHGRGSSQGYAQHPQAQQSRNQGYAGYAGSPASDSSGVSLSEEERFIDWNGGYGAGSAPSQSSRRG